MWIDSLLGLVAPSTCKGCNKTSSSGLCDACLREIIDEPYQRCVVCKNLTTSDNLCPSCHVNSPFNRVFVVGESDETLKKLVYDYKIIPQRHLAKSLVKLLDKTLPILPTEIIVAPIPTIPNHIRQRGFGHIELLARLFARRRHLAYRQLLNRTNNAVFHNLKANDRKKIAIETFAIKTIPNNTDEVLLIDDIYTTGATANAAARLLKESGVKNINLAIIARHSKK